MGSIIAIVLLVVRLIESIAQWYNKQETKGVIGAIVQIIKNFFLDIELYKKG